MARNKLARKTCGLIRSGEGLFLAKADELRGTSNPCPRDPLSTHPSQSVILLAPYCLTLI